MIDAILSTALLMGKLVCNPPGVRAAEIVIAAALIFLGIFLFYGSSRGRTIPFSYFRDLVLWTRITAAGLAGLGAIIFISAVLGLDC